MIRTKRKVPDLPPPKKRFKWWIRNNYVFLIIVGVVCLIATLILIFEVSQYERTRNMEALLQKSRRSMRFGGITDQDVEVLKKRYPNVNWDDQHDRQRWQKSLRLQKEKRDRLQTEKKLK